MANSVWLVVAALLAALCLQLKSDVVAGADCTFTVPSMTAGSCVEYDFSTVSGSYTLSDGKYQYAFGLCKPVSVPQQCSKSSSGAAAFQYNGSSCYSIGTNATESTFVYPVDPLTSSNGIRLVYTNGDHGSSATWPRAIILDMVCDAAASESSKPTTIAEFPGYTYTVKWASSSFCSMKTVQEKCDTKPFDSTWDSLRFRPRPSWYDEVKFGIFIHWGVFSVPSFKTEWYWRQLMTGDPTFINFHNSVYGCSGVQPDKFPCEGPSFKYADFAPMFKAEMFDPDAWADLFQKAGAKYIVLTSKHHEGWCNFPSSYHWNWNSVDEGPKKDLVGSLTDSVKAKGMHMGLYHSLREWYNPIYLQDNEDNCSTTAFVDEVLHPTLKEMVEKYEPEVIWGDGDSGDASCIRDSVKYWKSPEFLSWLYNESPVKDKVVVNSRWGSPAIGDYQTGGDRFTPGMILPYKWESCYTIQKTSWGYDRTGSMSDYWSTPELLMQLVSTVSCNGNLLLNVGPTADGRILPVFEQRLLEMGAWLEINGEAIYNSTPWRAQNDTAEKLTWYTASKDGKSVYAISFATPTPGQDFVLHQPKMAGSATSTTVTLLGHSQPIPGNMMEDGLHVQFPSLPYNTTLKYAWTYKLTGVV